MKKTYFLLALSLCLQYTIQAQTASSGNLKTSFSVKVLSKTSWNTGDGVPYKSVPGANLGITSFEPMDKNRTALLSDASNEILIMNPATGKTSVKFPVMPTPRDFAYDNGNFYVLNENQVNVYDETGKNVKSMPFPNTLVGVGRIARYNNNTWLLLPSGNSVELETGTAKKGWITATGNFVAAVLKNRNAYAVSITTADGKYDTKLFTTDKKTAGVYIVGSTADRIVLDVQTYISESPIQVERHLVSILLSSDVMGEIVSDVKVPDCYYVLSDKEFHLNKDGSVTHMITAPDGLHLFSLTETDVAKAIKYPSSVTAVKYHFNDHLLQMNEQK
jgi:hypothetical protein